MLLLKVSRIKFLTGAHKNLSKWRAYARADFENFTRVTTLSHTWKGDSRATRWKDN